MYRNFLLAVYQDKRTPTPFLEEFPKGHNIPPDTALPDHVYMDCLGFGPGCSCVQVGVMLMQFAYQIPSLILKAVMEGRSPNKLGLPYHGQVVSIE